MANLTTSTDVDNFMQSANKAAARTALDAAASATTITAGTGLSGGGDLTANRTLSVSFGTTAGTAAQGNDSRIVNAVTTSQLAAYATTAQLASYTPTARTISSGTGLTGGGDLTSDRTLSVSFGTFAGTVTEGNDSRLSNSRPPTTHASSHAVGGSDSITPASIGAASTAQLADYATTAQLAGYTPTTRNISSGTGLSGGGDLSADRTLSLSDVGTAGTYGSASVVPVVTTNAKGQVSSVSTQQIAILGSQVSGNISGNSANVTGTVAVANGGTGATDATNARTNLSAAKSGANTDITSVALTTGTISGIPSVTTDIVNKAYADSIGSGINFHDACDYATIAPLSPAATYNQPGGAGVGVNATLTGSTNVALQVDGTTVSVGQRILVKSQASQFQNGVYTVTQQGNGSTQPYILTRATDYDTSGSAPNEVQAGDFILVLNGSIANTAWVQQTPAPIVFGSSNIVFIQFAAASAAYLAGTGLSLSNNTFSITTTGVANFTAGSASAIPVITTNTQGQITNLTTAQVTPSAIGAVATADLTQLAVAGKVPQLDGSGLISTTQIPALTSAQIAQITPSGIGAVATSDLTLLASAGKVPQLNGSGFLSTAQLADIAGLPVGAVGSSTVVPVITTDTKGRITNLTTAEITGGGGSAGVASFSAGTTGFTPNTATTGVVTLDGTLNIANGGTGSTSQVAALTSLGAAPLADVMHRSVEYSTTALVTGNMVGNTFTITAPGTYSADGTVVVAGDVVIFTAQTSVTAAQNGPWQCTTAGATGVQPVFQRPSWFTGTVKPGLYCSVRFGTARAGFVYSLIGPVGTTEIVVGSSSVSIVIPSQRTANAIVSTNTFSGRQTFVANSGTVNPISFQTSTTQLSPLIANALEYVSDNLYLTNNAATVRNQIPYLASTNTWIGANAFNGRLTTPAGGGSFGCIQFNTASNLNANGVQQGSLEYDGLDLYFQRRIALTGTWTNSSNVVTLTGTSTTGSIVPNSTYTTGFSGPNQNILVTAITSNTTFTLNTNPSTSGTNASITLYIRESIPLRSVVSTGAAYNLQTGAYTLSSSDANGVVAINSASAITLTIPTTSTVPFIVGTQISIIQLSSAANQVTVAGGSGVTVYSQGAKFKTNTQYSVITLTKISFNEWVVSGDTVA